MCPACMTSLALTTAAVISTGGITAMVASRLGSTNDSNQGETHGEAESGSSDEHPTRRVAAGVGGRAAEAPLERESLDPRP